MHDVGLKGHGGLLGSGMSVPKKGCEVWRCCLLRAWTGFYCLQLFSDANMLPTHFLQITLYNPI